MLATTSIVGPDWTATVADWEEDSGTRYPVLNGRISFSNALINVWCAFCGIWHQHKRPQGIAGAGNGHRAAACHRRNGETGSPYSATGYVIRELNRWGWVELGEKLQGPLSTDCPQCKAPIGAGCTAEHRIHRDFHAKRQEAFAYRGRGWMVEL